MKSIDVHVRFEGVVTVSVPPHLSDEDAKLLAGKLALCNIIALAENPDAPEEDAFDDYESECSAEAKETADGDWEDAMMGGIGGTWTLGE